MAVSILLVVIYFTGGISLNRGISRRGIAIVGIRHINKSKGFGDPRNAGAHSVAWLQGCRSGLIVGHDAEDKAKRGIAQHKLNIAAESNTVFGFQIDADGVFSWTGESDLSISGMLAHKANESNEDRSAIADAIRFLKEQLADGGKCKGDLDIEARGEGINPANLNRAKMRLQIKPRKTGMSGAVGSGSFRQVRNWEDARRCTFFLCASSCVFVPQPLMDDSEHHGTRRSARKRTVRAYKTAPWQPANKRCNEKFAAQPKR